MKLKNPRYSIAFNLLSILGWVTAILCILFMPIWNKNELGTGNSGIWLICLLLVFITIGFICISFITYILEFIFDIQCNNKSLQQNKIYSCFVEFGLFLYIFPIIWDWAYIDYTLLPVLYLILSYILFKIVVIAISKLRNKIRSKKSNLQ